MIPTTALNFHHLRYFWSVARDGNLTRTARALRVSQSALSTQIRQLEETLGQPLFYREGRTLRLTEAGRVVLSYADDIFEGGERLLTTLRDGRGVGAVLRIGAVATLSRNFQESFVKPLFKEPEARFALVAGTLEDLVARLGTHELDVVLTNRPVSATPDVPFECRRLARQQVSLVGPPGRGRLRFPEDLHDELVVLPTLASAIRTGFDALCAERDVRPRVLAEADDMAMLRLLARDSHAIALLPSVVARDELSAGLLEELCVVPELLETFYAVTVPRHFPHPLLAALLARHDADLLEVGDADALSPRERRPSPAAP